MYEEEREIGDLDVFVLGYEYLINDFGFWRI